MVGAGGIGSYNKNDEHNGGDSSAFGIIATGGEKGTKGGAGGAGNGKGGSGGKHGQAAENGTNGSIYGYLTFTENVLYGGGGGGGNDTHFSQSSGGLGYGAKGEALGGYKDVEAVDGFGGGGGGGANDGTKWYKGGSGCVAIRIHLKSI